MRTPGGGTTEERGDDEDEEEGEELRRRKVATLYLLENEGFHSGKDEGNITKAAQRHGSNPARRTGATPTSCLPACMSVCANTCLLTAGAPSSRPDLSAHQI